MDPTTYDYITKSANFLVQVTVSFMLMLFCMYQIVHDKDANVYLPVLTGTAAYWLPAPKMADFAPRPAAPAYQLEERPRRVPSSGALEKDADEAKPLLEDRAKE